jgi:hypothetical protein
MSELLLLTSLPPPFIKGNRFCLDEEKYNWQILCIKSWIDTGHTVVSMNEPSEIELLKDIYPQVHFATAYRTTVKANNRPLVYISDAINFAKIQKFKRIALCNADVLITNKLNSPEIINNKSDLLYSNRINIDSINSTDGEIFGGIDYFNMSINFSQMLPETLFAFGLPWWDYWLPLFALNNNSIPHKLITENSTPILLHKKHPEAWRPDDLCILGNHFNDLIFKSSLTNLRFGSLDEAYKDHQNSNISSHVVSLIAQQARSVSQFVNENSNTYQIR